MAKAKFTTHGASSVTVEYTDVITEERRERTFSRTGSYVYELIGPYGRERQVCDRLERLGNTLMCNRDRPLIDVIRREYKSMRSKALREAAKN